MRNINIIVTVIFCGLSSFACKAEKTEKREVNRERIENAVQAKDELQYEDESQEINDRRIEKGSQMEEAFQLEEEPEFKGDPKAEKESVVTGFPVWAGVLTLLLCVALVGAVALLFKRLQKVERNLIKKTDALKSLKGMIESNREGVEEEFGSIYSQIRALMRSIESVSHSVCSNNETVAPVVASMTTESSQRMEEDATPVASTVEDVPIQVPKMKRNLYFGTPQNDIFTRETEVFKPGASIYCVMDTGTSEASYTIADREEALRVIKRSISSFLEPACDILGNTNRSFSRIIVKNPGKVKKVNGGWKIIEKAYVELVED